MNLAEAQQTIAFQADQIRRLVEQHDNMVAGFRKEHAEVVEKKDAEIAELGKQPALTAEESAELMSLRAFRDRHPNLD